MNPNENNTTPPPDQETVPTGQPQQPAFNPEPTPVAPTPIAQAPEVPAPAPTPPPTTAPVEPVKPVLPDIPNQPIQPGISPIPVDVANSSTTVGSSNGSQSATPTEDPGKTLSIVGFVMSLLGFGVISLIISILGRNKSKQAGHSNGFALAGIIISIITIVISIVVTGLLISGGVQLAQYCNENGTTVQNPDGSTSINCSAESNTSSGDGSNEGSSTMQFDSSSDGSSTMEMDATEVTPPTSQ